jgi:hypothetical protein
MEIPRDVVTSAPPPSPEPQENEKEDKMEIDSDNTKTPVVEPDEFDLIMIPVGFEEELPPPTSSPEITVDQLTQKFGNWDIDLDSDGEEFKKLSEGKVKIQPRYSNDQSPRSGSPEKGYSPGF